MKKIICALLCVLMIGSLFACGAKDDGKFTWERVGYFTDSDNNLVYISASTDEDNPGWYVGIISDDGMYGKNVALEGKTLHGNIADKDAGQSDLIVTVSYSGDKDVKVEIENGKTYIMTPWDIPEAAFSATVNTKGDGEIAYAKEGEEPEFDDEFPSQSAYIGLAEAETYVLAAKPDEGWKFVKWTLNGNDYSKDEKITVKISEDSEFIAVFGRKGTDEKHVDLDKVTTLGELLGLPDYGRTNTGDIYVFAFEQDWIFYRAVAELPKEVSDALFELDWDDEKYDEKVNALVSPLKITQIENLTANIPSQEELDKLIGKTAEELFNDGWYCSGWNLDEMIFYMNCGAYSFDMVLEGDVKSPDDFDDEDVGPLVVKSVTFTDIRDPAYTETD